MRVEFCLCLLVLGLIGAVNASLDPADDPKFITRPCPTFDIDCIRDYFAKNSHCDKSDGLIPVPLFAKHISAEIANSNVSIDIIEANLKGLEFIDIFEFYINNETNKLVLAGDVPYIQLESENTVFSYNRKGKESIVKVGSVVCQYGPMTFTANFQSITDLSLRNAKVYTYIEDPAPQYVLGPNVSANLGEKEMGQYQAMIENLSTSLQEGFVSMGTYLMATYIQMYVCNFGLDLDNN